MTDGFVSHRTPRALAGWTALASTAAWLLLAPPGPARASGFLVYEQSAAAVGKAGAVAADDARPDAAWFNPAAVALSPHPAGASLSGAFAASSTRFSPQAGGPGTDAHPGRYVVPGVFAHAALRDRLALTLALHTPFAFAVRWPEGWSGAEQSLETRFVVLAANPSLAVRLHPRVAVAVGGSLLRGSVDLSAALPPQAGGRGDLSGTAWGGGWNAAVFVRAIPDRLQFAVTYRSAARLGFAGRADFSPQDPAFALTYADQRARAQVTLPDLVTIAASGRPHPRVALSAEVNQARWSRFDRLIVDFEQGSTPDRIIERDKRDPLAFRLGAELDLPAWAAVARMGVAHDRSASTPRTLAPSAPDSDRLLVATGGGWTHGHLTVHAAYLLAWFLPADARGPEGPPGTYRSHAHVLAVSLTVR